MGQDFPENLFGSAASAGGAKLAAQAAFHLRAGALDVPTPAVNMSRKGPFHLSPVSGRRPSARVSLVQRDDRRADAEFLAGQSMVVFSVVSGVRQQAVDRKVVAGQAHRRWKLRRILTRSRTDHGRGEEITVRVTDQREFGPGVSLMRPLAAAPDEVTRRVTTFQSGGVDDRLRPFVDQATCPGAVEEGGQKKWEPPFLSSRSWAYLSVL